jgi:hypothetical protein
VCGLHHISRAVSFVWYWCFGGVVNFLERSQGGCQARVGNALPCLLWESWFTYSLYEMPGMNRSNLRLRFVLVFCVSALSLSLTISPSINSNDQARNLSKKEDFSPQECSCMSYAIA